MTASAALRRALEQKIFVARATLYARMFSSQFKAGARMVESGRLPAVHCVTGVAGRTQFRLVRIILRMTGSAVHWGALEFRILVAGDAIHADMLSLQREFRTRGMVECRRFPGRRYVTQCAVRAVLAFVEIII
jgi:hypothetical protein